MPSSRVADAIYDAAVSADPDSRYVVGWDARVAILADRLLPAG